MNHYSTNYEYKQINSAFIFSDPSYQRAVDVNRVKRIVARFNPNLVNPIKVSLRDGKYYVFDGQHTLAALKMKNGNENLLVECKVYRLTKEQEAELFAQQNGVSRAVETIAKLKALYAANDIEVVELVRLTKLAGFYIDFTKGKAANKITCVAKAFKIYKAVSAGEYVEILNMIKETWGGIPDSLNTEILGGMYQFFKRYKGDLKLNTFVKQLRKVEPVVIIREGKAMGNSWNGDVQFAIPILNHYNKGLRGNKLEPKF